VALQGSAPCSEERLHPGVESAECSVGALIRRPCIRPGHRSGLQPDANTAGLPDIGKDPDAHGRKQGCPKGRAVVVAGDHDVKAADIGQDLPPDRVARASAGGDQAARGQAELLEDLQGIALGKGHAFEDGPGQVCTPVVGVQAKDDATGVRVEVGSALASQVGQEDQTIGARCNGVGLFEQGAVGIPTDRRSA